MDIFYDLDLNFAGDRKSLQKLIRKHAFAGIFKLDTDVSANRILKYFTKEFGYWKMHPKDSDNQVENIC